MLLFKVLKVKKHSVKHEHILTFEWRNTQAESRVFLNDWTEKHAGRRPSILECTSRLIEDKSNRLYLFSLRVDIPTRFKYYIRVIKICSRGIFYGVIDKCERSGCTKPEQCKRAKAIKIRSWSSASSGAFFRGASNRGHEVDGKPNRSNAIAI